MYLLILYNTGHAEQSNCKDLALHTVINFVVIIVIFNWNISGGRLLYPNLGTGLPTLQLRINIGTCNICVWRATAKGHLA